MRDEIEVGERKGIRERESSRQQRKRENEIERESRKQRKRENEIERESWRDL